MLCTEDAWLCVEFQGPAPASSYNGDAWLQLDNNECLRVHSALLANASPKLAKALATAAATRPDGSACWQVLGISSTQVLLLLRMLYAAPPSSAWAKQQSSADLVALAFVCKKLGCTALLAEVDAALTDKAPQCLHPQDALRMYVYAHENSLRGFRQQCARALIAMLQTMPLDAIKSEQAGTAEQLLVPLLVELQQHQQQQKI